MKEELDFNQGKRGAIASNPNGKTIITTMLDDDILEWFRSQVQLTGGGNYQTLINNILHEYVQYRKELSEAKDKTTKEFDDVFKLLEKIAPRAVRNTKEVSLQKRDVKAQSKWEKVSFIGLLVSTFFCIMSMVILGEFKTVTAAIFTLVSMGFFTLFIISLLCSTIINDWSTSKNQSRKHSGRFELDAEYKQWLVNKISKVASQSTSKSIKVDFEFALKSLQAKKQTDSSLLPVLVALIAVFIVFGLSSHTQFLENSSFTSAYNLLKIISSLGAVLLPVVNFFENLNTESITNEYNKCLYFLEKAQNIESNVEVSHSWLETKKSNRKQSLMTQLKNIKIDGPEDFAANLDLYLSGEKRIEPDIR